MLKMAAQVGDDAFRSAFKLYRRREPPPDLRHVIDFSRSTPNHSEQVVVGVPLEAAAVSDADAAKVGLRPVREWRACSLHAHPGFIFICNPFVRGSQAFWIKQCLKTYPQKPNVCNLDMHMDPAHTQDIWDKSVHSLSRGPAGKRASKTLLEKLRWVTLGFHYNWDTKTYSAEHRSPFPADLGLLSSCVAAACGFPEFSAEAGILNYYRADSSLGIHADESELDHSRPLLSFCFGQSAIFLLGGSSRRDPPSAMLMQSGDVMVMSGPSRLLYHAVPRILTGTLQPAALEAGGGGGAETATAAEPVSEEEWRACSAYIQSSRVNMTVRQVLGPGQSFPRQQPKAVKRTSTDSLCGSET